MGEPKPIEPQYLEHVARIVGSSSAAAKALAEYRRRREAGEDTVILYSGRSYFVGPRPTGAPDAGA